MWIIAQTGFVSLVQDRKDKSKVWVRARIKEDIAMMFPAYADEIITKIGADYIYRLIVPKDVAALAMWNAVQDVDYDSHAKEVMNRRSHPNAQRMGAYYSIWTALAKLQPFAPYSHTPRPVPGMAPHQPALRQPALPLAGASRPAFTSSGHYDWSTHPDSATGYRNGQALTAADYRHGDDDAEDWPVSDAVDLINDAAEAEIEAEGEEWQADDGTVFNSVEDWESYLEAKAAGRVKAPRKRNPRRKTKAKAAQK